jgi:hypothetical protein
VERLLRELWPQRVLAWISAVRFELAMPQFVKSASDPLILLCAGTCLGAVDSTAPVQLRVRSGCSTKSGADVRSASSNSGSCRTSATWMGSSPSACGFQVRSPRDALRVAGEHLNQVFRHPGDHPQGGEGVLGGRVALSVTRSLPSSAFGGWPGAPRCRPSPFSGALSSSFALFRGLEERAADALVG